MTRGHLDLSATLMSYTWQLVSSTKVDNSGRLQIGIKAIIRKILLFLFMGIIKIQTLYLLYINSYIGGKNSQYNFSESYNFTTNNDILLLTPPWNTLYSDTVYCLHYDSEPLVLRMNYASGKGYEIDTLKIGRWH